MSSCCTFFFISNKLYYPKISGKLFTDTVFRGRDRTTRRHIWLLGTDHLRIRRGGKNKMKYKEENGSLSYYLTQLYNVLLSLGYINFQIQKM